MPVETRGMGSRFWDVLRQRRGITLSLAFLVLAAVVVIGRSSNSVEALSPAPSILEITVRTTPRTLANFGIQGLLVEGDQPVMLESAELLEVPEGVEVIDVVALNPAGFPPEDPSWILTWQGDLREEGYTTRPVQAVELHPGSTDTQWQLVVQVRSDVPGEYQLRGVRVRYRTPDGRTGFRDYPHTLHLLVSPST